MSVQLQSQVNHYKQQLHRMTIMCRSAQEQRDNLQLEVDRIPQLEKDIKLLEKELKELKTVKKGVKSK
jgi:hypothetical protein